MNVTVYLGWVTLLLVGGVLGVSAYGVYADGLTLKVPGAVDADRHADPRLLVQGARVA